MKAKKLGRPKIDSARDLRADLLTTSRALLEEGGPSALSMREVARRAGCTHQAPYHYFEDRETILAALVTVGFDDLADRLRHANDLAASAGVEAVLLASGQAYLDFALSQPGVFRIMFRPDVCNPQRFPQLQQAGARAHAELERLNRIVHGPRATAAQATILWAHVHGLAGLMIDGPLAMHLATDRARDALLQDVGERFANLVLDAVPIRGPRLRLKDRKRSAL
jgi:AcrR family transcriptional regulator